MNKIDKLRIAFAAPLPPPYGGIANWTKMVLDYLSKHTGIEAEVINTAPAKRVTEGRTLLDRVIGGGIGMLKARNEIKNMIINNHIDCLHIATSGSLSVIRDYLISCLLTKYKVPFVYHIHFGRIPQIKENSNKEWKIIKNVINKAKSVIVIDRPTFESLYSEYGNKIKYIPNPIDINPMPKPDFSLHNTCMFLGWVIKEKGIMELLEAWNIVSDIRPNWNLNIVGPYKDDTLNEIKGKYKLNNVKFTGEKSHSEAMDLLNNSDIFILPSYSEGCPYVIMEALALGKKVIGSNVGNIPEMIEKRQGEVVGIKEVKRLSEAIIKMIDFSEFEGENVRKSAIQEYGIYTIIEQYINLWM